MKIELTLKKYIDSKPEVFTADISAGGMVKVADGVHVRLLPPVKVVEGTCDFAPNTPHPKCDNSNWRPR